MGLDLDGLCRLALAKTAIAIEKSAGATDPKDPLSVADHERRLIELEAEACIAKLALQEQCEHLFPGTHFHSNTLTFCQKCGAEVAGRTFSDLRPMSEEEREQLMLFDEF